MNQCSGQLKDLRESIEYVFKLSLTEVNGNPNYTIIPGLIFRIVSDNLEFDIGEGFVILHWDLTQQQQGTTNYHRF